jgi:Ca-activated chloride channel family protein
MSDQSGQVRIKRSLLLTDGLANVGITTTVELTKHAHELRRRGISTTTLGVGLDFDEDLLTSMAEAGGGNFQFIASSGELRGFFERELGELLTVVAAGLTFSITLPHGLRAHLVNAFPTERHGKRIDVALGDLPATDELNLIFAIDAAPASIGTNHLVSLGAVWADPATDSRQTFDLTLSPLRVVDPKTVDATPIDSDVAEQAALQRAAAGQREAMRLDRQGRFAESRAHLRHAATLLAAAPMTAQVSESYETAMMYAEQDETSGLSESIRKTATYDAFRRQRGKRDGTQ